MKKFKYIRIFACVIFSLLLVCVSILPCFAVDHGASGGSGFGSPNPIYSVPITYNVCYDGIPVTDYNHFYFATAFDPLFSPSSVEDTSTQISGQDYSKIYEDYSAGFAESFLYYSYDNYSGSLDPYLGGSASCHFDFSSFSSWMDGYTYESQDLYSLYISFDCNEFYAWKDPVNGKYSEFSIVIDLSNSSIDPYSFAQDYYVSFYYYSLGTLYSREELHHINLPLSDFINVENNTLTISVDSYFSSLSSSAPYYLVKNFSLRCYAPGSSVRLVGDVTYTYNPNVVDVFNLYPSPAEKMELNDYTAWITTALEGFFMLEIFPGFYLSGFLMVILGFTMFIWALKVFAGG